MEHRSKWNLWPETPHRSACNPNDPFRRLGMERELRNPFRQLIVLSLTCLLFQSCITPPNRLSEIQQNFSDFSNRLETYHESQITAQKRQQKALNHIRELVKKESNGIPSKPRVFEAPTGGASTESIPSVPLAPEPSQTTPKQSETESLNQQEARRLFQTAMVKYNQHQFSSAAEEFLIAYSYATTDAFKAQCLFWSGECHFRNQDWDKAIQCYNHIERYYPEETIIPGTLLKKGYTQINQGLLHDGKQTLRLLIKNHPQSQEALFARERLRELGEK